MCSEWHSSGDSLFSALLPAKYFHGLLVLLTEFSGVALARVARASLQNVLILTQRLLASHQHKSGEQARFLLRHLALPKLSLFLVWRTPTVFAAAALAGMMPAFSSPARLPSYTKSRGYTGRLCKTQQDGGQVTLLHVDCCKYLAS